MDSDWGNTQLTPTVIQAPDEVFPYIFNGHVTGRKSKYYEDPTPSKYLKLSLKDFKGNSNNNNVVANNNNQVKK